MCGLRRDSTLNMDSAFVFHAYPGVKPRPSLGDTSGAMGRTSLCRTLIPTKLLASGMPRHTLLHRRFDGVLCRTATPTKQHLECQATRCCVDDLMLLYRTATRQSMVGGPISICQHSTNIPMDLVHPRGPVTRCRCVLV